jgi:hypothetical protein
MVSIHGLAVAEFPAGLGSGEPEDVPAEPDHLNLVGQHPLDRHHDRLGADPAPLDHATHGGVTDPPRHRVDGLLLLSLEPLAQRRFAARLLAAAHACSFRLRAANTPARPGLHMRDVERARR